LIRNSLSQGNKEVQQVLKDTKHDKDMTFDKIIAMMQDNCISKVEPETVKKILMPENFSIFEENYTELLKFNKNVFQIIGPKLQYSPSEKLILDYVSEIKKNPGFYEIVYEEHHDILTLKFGKYKHLIIGMIIGFSLFLLFVIILNLIFRKK
jgi:hypothetical protein